MRPNLLTSYQQHKTYLPYHTCGTKGTSHPLEQIQITRTDLTMKERFALFLYYYHRLFRYCLHYQMKHFDCIEDNPGLHS